MTDKPTTAGGSAPAERIRTKPYTLIEPIKATSGETVTAVTVRRPKGRELREAARMMEDDQVLASYQMIAWLTGLAVEDIDEMDGEDVTNLSEIVENFTPTRTAGSD